MRIIFNFIARIIANSIGIVIAAYFVSGIAFSGGWEKLLITGFVLAIANSVVRPILRFITGPLVILTMGLFMIVVNIIILWAVTLFIPELTISGLWAYFWGVVILSILNALVHSFAKKKHG